MHAPTFKLKHRLGFTLLEQPVSGRIVERNVFKGKLLLPHMAFLNKFAGNFQNGQRGQAQKVKLHQPDGFHVVFVVLADRRLTARLLVQGAKIRQLARGNQHATSVHAHVARQAFELLGQIQQGFDFFFLSQTLSQNRLFFQSTRNGDVLPRLVGNELADAIAKGVAHVQHSAHVPNGCAGGHGAKRGNLAHRFFAVFVFDVVNHAVAVGLAKVNIKVGHGHPLGVQKALKQKLVFQRVKVGDLEGISHQRACPRAAARPHGATVLFGPVDEVTHNQKVAWEPHIQNGVDFKFQTLHIAGALCFTGGRVGVQMLQTLLQPVKRLFAEKCFQRHVRRNRKVRQLRLA